MKQHQKEITVRGTRPAPLWHGFLDLLLAATVATGFGYLGHAWIGHSSMPFSGFAAGVAAGLIFCFLVFARLRRRLIRTRPRACDRRGAVVTFPHYVLGLIRYGLIAGAAVGLGVFAWIGVEELALERPLQGTVEIVLGILVSVSIGMTAFHILLRAFESD